MTAARPRWISWDTSATSRSITEPPNAAEDAAVAPALQECADVADEELADGLANHLERQAIAPAASVQLAPLLTGALQLLRCQQLLRFIRAESTQLERANCTPKHDKLQWCLAAGQHQAALVRCSAHRLEQARVASHAFAIAPLLLARLEQGL